MPHEEPTSSEMQVRGEASSDLNDILALRGENKPFQRYFLKEPARQIEQLIRELTTDRTLTERERDHRMGELAVWRRIATKLRDDEIGNRAIIGTEDEES